MPNEAKEYLSPSRDTFWRWNDSGEVIAWANGTTIAFREELLAVLEHLAPAGLPPLGAVALLLAATRASWPRLSAEPSNLSEILGASAGTESPPLLSSVLGGLDRVHYLEEDLRNSLAAQQALAEIVFDGLQARTSPELARAVIRQLDEGVGEEIFAPQEGRRSSNLAPASLVRDLHSLDLGLVRFDAESLRLRLQTGLDDVPRPADLDWTPAQRVRALLAELDEDDEHRALASLARNLMAAVALRRHISDREELPIGGVSDITNRGPLDRLLLSELAHDDLTLAVRVAMNEALYVRRESPPRTPTRLRAMLLEAGIRSWGVPRVYATAVALALTATADSHCEVVAYRASGNSIEPVDLTTRAGLVDHLAALEADLHPGEAMEAFLATVAEADEAAEPVLVTTEDAFEASEFQRAVAPLQIDLLHVATVNRGGRFRLIEKTRRGHKTVREAQLALDELTTPSRRNASELLNRAWAVGLPAILSVTPFPLLLSQDTPANRLCRVEGRGALAFTKDGRLLHWTQRRRGARQIADDLPGGSLWWNSGMPEGGVVRAVVGYPDPSGLHLLRIDLDRVRCDARRLDIDRGACEICSHNGVLFAVFGSKVQVVSASTGEVVQTLELPTSMLWNRSRFFRHLSDGAWYALAYDGRSAKLEPVLADVESQYPQLLTLFESNDFEGPIGVTQRGDLYMTATNTLRRVDHQVPVLFTVAVSNDGREIVLAGESGDRHADLRGCIVDVKTLALLPSSGVGAASAGSFRDVVRPANLRKRFVRVGVDRRGLLTLTCKALRHLAIDYDSGSDRIRLQHSKESCDNKMRRTFKPVETSSEVGFNLSVATWADGSQAFLDSRGLLHLKSSDASVPEVSITLKDGTLSGWCSDGRLWGEEYFIGEKSESRQPVFRSTIKAFTERLLTLARVVG